MAGSIHSKRVAKHIEVEAVYINVSESVAAFYRKNSTKLAVTFGSDDKQVTVHLDASDIAQLKKLMREHAIRLRALADAIVSPIG